MKENERDKNYIDKTLEEIDLIKECFSICIAIKSRDAMSE